MGAARDEAASSMAPRGETVIQWYTRCARVLPWRMPPGQDYGGGDVNVHVYRVWLSEVMAQQTRLATVVEYWTR